MKDINKEWDLRDKYVKEWSLLDVREKLRRMISYIDIFHKEKDHKDLKGYLSRGLYRNFQALNIGMVKNFPNAWFFLDHYLEAKECDISLEKCSILYSQALPFLIQGAKTKIHELSWVHQYPDPFGKYDDFRIWLEEEKYPEFYIQYDLKYWKKNFIKINEKLWEKDKVYFSPDELELVNKEMKNIHSFILHIQNCIEQKIQKRYEEYKEKIAKKTAKKREGKKYHREKDIFEKISDEIVERMGQVILKLIPEKYKKKLNMPRMLSMFNNYIECQPFDTWKEI